MRTMAAGPGGPPGTDRQLLEAFSARGDEAAFAALVACHGPMVLRVCRRVLGHEQDAEDAFQATFLVLARSADSIRRREALASWLYGVAYRTALKARRSAARRRSAEARLLALAPRPAPPPTWDEVQAALDEEVRRLPEAFRAAFVLCALEDRTKAEAAAELGCKEGTVSSRLDRARRLLRARLARRGIELSALLALLSLGKGGRAAVPTALAQATVRFGLLAAAGGAAAGVIPAHVATLAAGGSRAMVLGKTGLVAVVLLAAGLLTATLAGGAPAEKEMPRPPAAGAPAAAGPKRETPRAVEVRGRVLEPDGRPCAGARVYVVTNAVRKKEDLHVAATTGADGRFQVAVTPAQREKGAKIAVAVKGFGPAWVSLGKDDKGGEYILRLAHDDVPIDGRVLDLQGRPIAGARVKVLWLDQGDLKRWLAEKEHNAYPMLDAIRPVVADGPDSVTTGPDGRFRLTGFGRDRVVLLEVTGAGIEDSVFHVVTRTEGVPEKRTAFDGTYRAAFDHLAGPSKPLTGTVREKGTGKPLAGVTVASVKFIKQYVQTDARGRYRIEGARKNKDYTVSAGGIPFFTCTRDVPDTDGFEPITVDFELERGVAVTGRLTNGATGKPVAGHVVWTALAGNPFLKDYTEIEKGSFIVDERGEVGPDGSFTVVAIPGPGLLCAYSWDQDAFLPAGKLDYRTAPLSLVLEEYHALVPINPSPRDPKSCVCDVALEPGQTLNGSVADADGRPLAGAHAAGLRPLTRFWFRAAERLQTASFAAGGMGPGRRRVLLFVHPEKKLARVLTLRGDEPGPLTVRLEPTGSVAGRILDARGRPWPGLKVTATYRVEELREAAPDQRRLPWELFLSQDSWGKVLNRETMTDAEGRFRLDGLVPGVEYDLRAAGGEGAAVLAREWVSTRAGVTRDLGEMKSKEGP
jgi:RNA polymerase sigma factor (sigma-70 family)